jgi:hypothetical protein
MSPERLRTNPSQSSSPSTANHYLHTIIRDQQRHNMEDTRPMPQLNIDINPRHIRRVSRLNIRRFPHHTMMLQYKNASEPRSTSSNPCIAGRPKAHPINPKNHLHGDHSKIPSSFNSRPSSGLSSVCKS